MGRIGAEPAGDIASPRKRADFRVVPHHERVWQNARRSKTDDGSTTGRPTNGTSQSSWCGSSRTSGLIPDRLESGREERGATPSTYREGGRRRPVGQGPMPATPADSLLQRQGSCCQTSYDQPRQENTRGGRRDLDHLGPEIDGCAEAKLARLPTAAAAPSAHPEARQKDDEAAEYSAKRGASFKPSTCLGHRRCRGSRPAQAAGIVEGVLGCGRTRSGTAPV